MSEPKPGRLLIVDDEVDLTTVLREILRSQGYEVAAFTAPDKALAALKSNSFDLMLADLMMPEMDGITLLGEALKIDPLLVSIIMTGQGTVQTAVDAMKAGAFDYVLKPFKAKALTPVLARAMEVRRLRMENVRLRETMAVYELSQTIAYTLDHDILVNKAADAAIKQLDADEVSLMLVTPALARMCGYDSPEELTAAVQNIDQLYVDSDRRAELVRRLEEHGLASGFESRIHRKDGSLMWISENVRSVRNVEGKPLYYQGTWEDITTRKQAEEALRERERYYRSLLFSMHEEILVVDRDFRIVDSNQSLMPHSGLGRDEIIGRRCYEVSHGCSNRCDHGANECALHQVFRTGVAARSRHEHTSAEGSKIWVDILYSPLKDEMGNVTHVIQAIRDVTHEMELQRQFRQAQKMEAIGTLAGGIAHDFNNILGIMLGYTEISMFDQPEGSPLRENLTQVLTAGQRARDLVRQILTFSRQADEERSPIRVGIIVKETLKMLRAALPSTIEIVNDIQMMPNRSDSIMASPTQIHQVLMNLCANAAHAMHQGGGILEVSLSCVDFCPMDTDRPRDSDNVSYVRLAVSDTGHGMDKDTVERIFEPYFTTKEVGEGTGLGLSVVHGIVKSHGGVITVRSEPGTGTTFEVFFPQSKRVLEAEGGLVVDAPSGGHESILFVDDEKALAEWGKQMLERLGYRAFVTTSSKEALEVFRRQPDQFDLVVSDLTMPHMTGIELAGELMAIRPDIPVILCTGFSDLVTRDRVRDAGIRELIMKPFIMTTVANSIRRVLDAEGDLE